MSWVNASQHGSASAAVLLDRDGTLIFDEPYCGDPSRVRPVHARVKELLGLSGVDPQDVVAAVRRLTTPVAGGPA
jgi:histidinol phosphatase-like enzyme